MKTLLAAAIVVSARSQDETSLMQGLARRVDGKLGADGNSKRHDTTKLMETATKMLKNGAGVTPDVVSFITETLADLNAVLDPIAEAHRDNQAQLAAIVGRMDAAVAAYQDHCDAHAGDVVDYTETNRLHKECRQMEAHKCGDSRECEVELEILWQIVKREEEKMREIHIRIDHSWCVDPLNPPHGDRTCFDQDSCWHWSEEQAMEGPETSQTQLSYDSSNHYPIADYSSEVRDFRSVSVTTFEEYIEQKRITESAWEAYNSKIVICSELFTALESKMAECDTKQDGISEALCGLTETDRTARREFGLRWKELNDEYDATEGQCTNSAGDACDIHAVHAHEVTGGATWEGAAVDLTCSCTGIRELEFDRKREWETLAIVQCLLTTVYTHVVHSIETGEPCPTTDTHEEQTESEINHCHHIELELTANLTIDYCGDDLPLECPTAPECEPPEPVKCSAEYLWDTQGHLGSFMDSFVPNLPVHSQLSTAGWGSCAAPKACIPCGGSASMPPNPAFTDTSAPCMEHQSHLLLGENDRDTFRCHGTWCLPMEGRCNGVSNCHDGSDEVGCDTAWAIPQWLAVNDVCREGATVVPGQQDDVQFFCADGSCTAVEGRCNGHNNCADGSDEANCPSNVDGVTVETSTGLQATLETITNGAHVFHDRGYTFKSIGSFTGIKMVKISNEDKDISQDHVAMKLRFQQPTSVYIVTTHDNTLDWLYSQGWIEVPALTGLEYSGVRMTPDKWWSEMLDHPLLGSNNHLDSIDKEEQHYGPGHVWEKTFPAGVVSLNGNGGGSGYDWSPPVKGGHGSYLTFVAHPSNPPSPLLPVEHDSLLTAYWDAGACGAHGNDHNAGWCGGVVNGNHPASHCQEFVTVSSSICASEVATLHSYEGDGTCCSSVTIDSCNYAYFAQYRCAEDHEVPVVVTPPQYDTRLAAYWDRGVCGPHGEDANWDWCNRGSGNNPASECATSVEVSTDICATGHASLESTQGTGACCESVNLDGCNYAYYAQYVCSDATGPIVLTAPVVHDNRLAAYWDSGTCGPRGDDHNWGWCGERDGNCPASVAVDSSICASNTARLETMSGTGQCCSSVVIDGCNYAYHAQYVCTFVPSSAVAPSSPESQYLGCFVDDPARDLGAMEEGGAIYTHATCLARCQGSQFMSLQYGGECFCADAYGTASQYRQADESECNMVRNPCSSDSAHNCGGTWHQAIYQIS